MQYRMIHVGKDKNLLELFSRMAAANCNQSMISCQSKAQNRDRGGLTAGTRVAHLENQFWHCIHIPLSRMHKYMYYYYHLHMCTWISFIEEVFIFIHPDVCYSLSVVIKYSSYTTRPRIWGDLSEYMPDPGAGSYQYLSTTLPYLMDGTQKCMSKREISKDF